MDIDVLLIEDDEVIGAGLERMLTGADLTVRWERSAKRGITAALAASPRLVITDLGLPDLDGIEVCRRLRRDMPAVKILVLTARASEMDVVLGLDAGADDYLTKPFGLAEFQARVRSLLRQGVPVSNDVNVGGIRIDAEARRAWDGERQLDLRPKEFDLLLLLVTNAGRVVSRDAIMRHVWDTDWMGTSKTIDMHVSNLRAALGDVTSDGRITTLRGHGYRFDAP